MTGLLKMKPMLHCPQVAIRMLAPQAQGSRHSLSTCFIHVSTGGRVKVPTNPTEKTGNSVTGDRLLHKVP